MSDLPELLDHYFSLGVAEGKEGRDHDTETGEAQATRDLIEARVDRLRRELAEARAEAEMLQEIIDTRPAINAGLPETYVRWSQSIYSGDAIRVALSAKGARP